MKKIISISLLFSIILAACPFAMADNTPDSYAHHITVLATSDIHGNIIGYSYEDDKPTSADGMARLDTYIRQVREENPNTLLIDGGDAIQGTILTDDICSKNPEEPHPVIAAMNAMCYDAMTLGNHEFDWGVPTLMKIAEQAEFPIMAENIMTDAGELLTGKGWIIKEVDGVRVAIISVSNPYIPIWDGNKEGVSDLSYETLTDGVERAISEIGDEADVVVVSAHASLSSGHDKEKGSDEAEQILEKFGDKVDILQCAHTHETVCEASGSTLIGEVRNGAVEIIRFDLYLDDDKNIIDGTAEVVTMTDIEPSEEITTLPVVAGAHEATRSFVTGGTALGSTTARFQPENEIATLPAGRLMDTAVIDLINKVQLEASGADVSACSLFKDTSDLPEGDINYGNIFDIYKYDNILYRVNVTGAELIAYMEWSAQYYNQWVPGDINISFNKEIPGYRYDMFSGVDYEIDLSKPAGQRIVNVMFNGEPLKDDQVLSLAVSDYRYSSVLKGNIVAEYDWESSESIRSLIVKYFADNSPVTPTVDNNWCIVGCDLSLDDVRRDEIIDLINSGLLDPPYNNSYNLNDYDEIMASVYEDEYELDIAA